MVLRNKYPELEKALEIRQIIAITGLRRIGKTTALKYLFDKIETTNKLFLDLEKLENRDIFNTSRYDDIIQSLKIEGIDFDEKAYIFLDEIQLIRNIASFMKYIYDNYNVKFVVSGSSSYYMKGAFTESLAGRKRIFELWPLDFKEFLVFKGVDSTLPKFSFNFTNKHFISKYNSLYHEYVQFGGFPEVVLEKDRNEKVELLKDITNSYLKFDILFLSDFTNVDELYKLIKLLSARVGSKVDYTKLSNISGISRKRIKDYLLFLENTYFIKLVKPFVKNADREIALQQKLYFTDNGILNTFSNISGGAIFENAIANQLSLLGNIKYYAKRTGQEIDFIIDENTAIEVKETPTAGDYKTLQRRANSIGINKTALVGLNTPGNGFGNFLFGGAIY
ncbi:MAG: ATP-binding protein [Bacteroidales bacterium]|nr:ATP-binding protein [Bacteroidales bacterium]